MGELRTVSLYVATAASALESLFVEKTMRIKKILLIGSIQATEWAAGTVQLSKREALLATKEHGHLAFLYVPGNIQDAALFKNAKELVIDLGADYIEIEEDDYLHLYAVATAGTVIGRAIIYYEE